MGRITTTATRWTVLLLSALALVLLAAAVPALAQSGADQYDPADPAAEEVSATGTIERLDAEPVVVDGLQICELSTHSITDEATGQYYDLESDVVNLDAYAGQRATVTGTSLPTPAIGGAGAERCPDLEVTSIVSADNPDSGQPAQETVTVTFQLTIDGVVPEGRTFGLGYKPIIGWDFQGVSFCTTDTEDPDLPDESTLPVCENGGAYSGTLEVPAGVPFSFDYLVHADADDVRCDPPRMGPLEVFYSDTRTFTEDATVSATYIEDGLPPECRAVDEDDGGSGQYGGGQYGTGSGDTVSSPSPGNDTGLAQLPATGGASLLTLGAGALLVGGGLLIRKVLH